MAGSATRAKRKGRITWNVDGPEKRNQERRRRMMLELKRITPEGTACCKGTAPVMVRGTGRVRDGCDRLVRKFAPGDTLGGPGLIFHGDNYWGAGGRLAGLKPGTYTLAKEGRGGAGRRVLET